MTRAPAARPRKWLAGLLAGTAVLAPGCATYQQRAAGRLEAFKAGNSAAAIAYYTQRTTGPNRQLYRVEAGRLLLLEGEFTASHEAFGQAIDQVFDLREGAMIRLEDVGGSVISSTFLDDNSMPYQLPSFEAVFTFQQQALNSIFLGDIEAAAVELRRAVAAQDQIADQYERQVARALRDANDPHVAAGLDSVSRHYADMGPVLGLAKSGFQNPYVWFFSGLMYELQQDPGNAYIAYKKAWELAPEHPSLQQDLLRLARTQNPDEWTGFRERFARETPAEDPTRGELVVIYEEGLISQRHEVGLPIVLPHGIRRITFPEYRDGPYPPARIRVLWDGTEAGGLEPLCHVQAMAYHDLKERMPGIAARNISRVLAREVAHHAGRQSESTLGTVLAVGINISALADRADTRGWYSLPMVVQMLRTPLEPGERTLTLLGAGPDRRLDIPVTLHAGETKLVWLADHGVRLSFGLASLTHAECKPAKFSRIVGDRQTHTGGRLPALVSNGSRPGHPAARPASHPQPMRSTS